MGGRVHQIEHIALIILQEVLKVVQPLSLQLRLEEVEPFLERDLVHVCGVGGTRLETPLAKPSADEGEGAGEILEA